MLVQLSVIGDAAAEPGLAETAYEVGRRAAERGWIVINGGLGGVMEAASRGAREAGGTTVGILPTYDAATANDYIDIIIPTGLGHARNTVLVAAASGVIAVGGRYGTLSEIALALKLGKPVVGINTWPGIEGVWPAPDAEAAVAKLASLLK
ncbi:MAG TPA: TIGR00725 family protein [bacterium]|nr:TIGR00725 family protein [bacterium]